MNHFTIMDMEELEYEVERGYAGMDGSVRLFEDIPEEPAVHHLVFFDFSNSGVLERILHKTLRDNDTILQRGNCYYIRLTGISEGGKRAVVDRIIKSLEKEGLYSKLNLDVDASMLEEDSSYSEWYPIAV